MNEESARKWILKALEDLKIAGQGLSFPEEEMATGPICFHCQQAVEKLLKAYLIFNGVDFGKTHDLEYLLYLASEKDYTFKDLNIGNLTEYAVKIRYPDEFYIPTVDEAKEAYYIAIYVKEFIFRKINIEHFGI